MSKRYLFALVPAMLLFAGVANAQHPMLDAVADQVVQKYQQSSCEQLWQQRGHRDRRGNRKQYSCCMTIHSCAPLSSTKWRRRSLTRCFNAA